MCSFCIFEFSSFLCLRWKCMLLAIFLTKITNLLFLLVHYFKLKRLFYGVIWNQRIVIRLFCSTLVLCQKIKSLANYILWDGFFCSQIELVHLNITCVYATLNKIKYTQKTLILCTVLPYRICPALPSSWLRKGLFLKALCVHIIAHSYKSYFKPKQKYWPGLSATASCDAGDQCDSLDPIVFTHSKLSHFIASSAFVGLKKPSDLYGGSNGVASDIILILWTFCDYFCPGCICILPSSAVISILINK